VGDQDAILAAVEEFLTGVRPAAEPDRVLATVLAMEVVHAVETVAGVGQRRWRAIDEAYRALVRDQLERHHGQPAGTAGSGFLATFNGPARGIRCALAIISESRSLGIELRAALHTGECELVDGGLGGEAFRRATSLMAQAEPGEVLVSSIVRDLVAGSGIQLEERDARSTPGEPGSRQLFRVGLGRRPAHLAGGAEPPPPAARPQTVGPLTPREREVAVLLARGLTNRQIGDQLVISAATAERHVVNIFNKLGFHSRSQLAAWVVEHGLGRASS
jgi:DNA-binding CsgD family transcriptional regulator/class 3 adenylate cyclase